MSLLHACQNLLCIPCWSYKIYTMYGYGMVHLYILHPLLIMNNKCTWIIYGIHIVFLNRCHMLCLLWHGVNNWQDYGSASLWTTHSILPHRCVQINHDEAQLLSKSWLFGCPRVDHRYAPLSNIQLTRPNVPLYKILSWGVGGYDLVRNSIVPCNRNVAD